MACSSGCPTQDHESFGACMKAKSAIVAYCGQGGQDYSAQKRLDADLAYYKDARQQGIQPASTQRDAVDRAHRLSDAAGSAWQA